MSNLEKPITATAAAWQPGLLDRWDLQGGRADGARVSKFQYQISNLQYKFDVRKNKLSYHAFQQITVVNFRFLTFAKSPSFNFLFFDNISSS